MKKLIVFSILALLTLVQCKSADKEKEIASELPRDFEEFYEKFHQDSAFQMAHIQFPLEGAKKATGNNLDLMVPVKWFQEDWIMHKSFDSYEGTFSRQFYQVGSVVIEKISDKGGFFAMERRFTKMEGEWVLIYYSVTD
jgi:hypothetical protein